MYTKTLEKGDLIIIPYGRFTLGIFKGLGKAGNVQFYHLYDKTQPSYEECFDYYKGRIFTDKMKPYISYIMGTPTSNRVAKISPDYVSDYLKDTYLNVKKLLTDNNYL